MVYTASTSSFAAVTNCGLREEAPNVPVDVCLLAHLGANVGNLCVNTWQERPPVQRRTDDKSGSIYQNNQEQCANDQCENPITSNWFCGCSITKQRRT
jgi:hypothetical protein